MRTLVIVVPDLYLPRELRGEALHPAAFAGVPGFEQVARFGTRVALRNGWREWLLARTGRAELARVAPACIAAAALAAPRNEPPPNSVPWIAIAVHLRAGLTRVHLDHGGLLRLSSPEQLELAAGFGRTFGSSGHALTPLPAGEFLLDTPGLAAVPTAEPERCVGGDSGELVAGGTGGAPLRRLLSEIEMWLHTQPLNAVRVSSGAAPVTALWPWGSSGRIVRPELRPSPQAPLAFGRDAWLEGLWRLQGQEVRAPPQRLETILAGPAGAGVLLAEAGGELHADRDTLADAVSRIDRRYVSPAVAALRNGTLDELALILNDAHLQLQRASLRRFWRRARGGLTGFA
ncbi:MAG: hypothetical protein JO274_09000 [Gammaproteobacteria bacterium]|nr:hypothetical protein [Gammaproteobacteria bacterium]